MIAYFAMNTWARCQFYAISIVKFQSPVCAGNHVAKGPHSGTRLWVAMKKCPRSPTKLADTVAVGCGRIKRAGLECQLVRQALSELYFYKNFLVSFHFVLLANVADVALPSACFVACSIMVRRFWSDPAKVCVRSAIACSFVRLSKANSAA